LEKRNTEKYWYKSRWKWENKISKV
jgi:hypothetical protein